MSNTEQANRRHRYIRRLAIAALLFVATWGFVYGSNRVKIVRLDNIFDPRYGYAAGFREKYFTHKFPSAEEIEAYLTDATMLFSNPPTRNIVYYFGNDHRFMSWHHETISKGQWQISPQIHVLRLGSQWRIAVVQVFCSVMSDLPPEAQQDNCFEVGSLDSVFTQGRGARHEYRKGNTFSLDASQKRIIKPLPKTEISIDSLVRENIHAQ